MAEQKRVITWDYVSTLMNAVNQALTALQAGTDEKNPIFITDVQPLTAGKNVSVSVNNDPNEDSVASILTDDTNLRVTVEWDRGFAEYQGTPTVNSQPVQNNVTKQGSTFTGTVDIDITGATELLAEFGGTSYSVGLTEDVPPTITDIAISTVYPGSQTSLKENDNVDITVTADKPFTQIIVDNFELAKPSSPTFTATTSKTITISVADRGLTSATAQRVRVSVVSDTGSESDKVTSTDTAPVNNSVPQFAITSIFYAGGRSALKNAEIAEINFTTTNVSVIGDIDVRAISVGQTIQLTDGQSLAFDAGTGNGYVEVGRLAGDYNDDTNNLRFTLTFTENGATRTFDRTVAIANVNPALTQDPTVIVRSGVSAVTIGSSFTQKVKVTAASIGTNRGTLGFTSTGSNFVKSKNVTLSASDTDIHSDTTQSITLSVEGLSGMTTDLTRSYKIRGFAQKNFTISYDNFIQDIGVNIVTPANVAITATIDTTPSLAIAQNYKADEGTIDNVGDWSIVDIAGGTNGKTTNNGIQLATLSLLQDFKYASEITLSLSISEGN